MDIVGDRSVNFSFVKKFERKVVKGGRAVGFLPPNFY